MTDNHDSLMREVQGELDREKYARLWEKYGSLVIGAAIAFVASVGGYNYWVSSQKAAVEQAGSSYESALTLLSKDGVKPEDVAKAQSAFETLSKDSSGGYQVLSQLQVAGAHVVAGKKKEALALYETLSKSEDTDVIFREFASLQAASLRAGEADWTEMENRLTTLSGGTGAWRHSAQQLLGVAAFDAGKLEKAREVFEQLLSSPKVPSTIRDRASLFMARIVAHDMKAESEKEKAGGSSSEPTTANASTEGALDKPMTDSDKPKATDGASEPTNDTGGAAESSSSP